MRELFRVVLQIDKDSEEPIMVKDGCIESLLFDNYKNVYVPESILSDAHVDVEIPKVNDS